MHPILTHRDHLAQRAGAVATTAQAAPAQGGFLRRLARGFAQRWRRRKMIATFHAMDDRLLYDIGIERSQIERVVDGLDARELRMVPVAPDAGARRGGYGSLRLVA